MAWRRAEERAHWKRLQRRRGKEFGDLEHQSRREWAELYGHQGRQREQLAKDGRGALAVVARGGGAARARQDAAGERENARALAGGREVTDPWLRRMLDEKPRKVVAVALANRMARIIWAVTRVR